MLMLRYLAAIERPYSGASVMRRFFPSMLMVALFATLTACGGGGGGGSFSGGVQRAVEPLPFSFDPHVAGERIRGTSERFEPSESTARHRTVTDDVTGTTTTTLEFDSNGDYAYHEDGTTYRCESTSCEITYAASSPSGAGEVTEGVIHVFNQPRYVTDFFAQPASTSENSEPNGMITIRITLDHAVPSLAYGGTPMVFDYVLGGIEAVDIIGRRLSGEIMVPRGVGVGEVQVEIEDDDLTEGTETMTVTLRVGVGVLPENVAGVGLETQFVSGVTNPFNVPIRDNETPPTAVNSFLEDIDPILEASGSTTVRLTLNQSIPAGDSALLFPYTISGIQAGDITDNNADSDNNSLTGTITVAPGSATEELIITAAQDTLTEGDETMTVTLGALPTNGGEVQITNGVPAPQITITDDDLPPTLQNTVTRANPSEASTSVGGVTLTLSRALRASESVVTTYTLTPGGGATAADINEFSNLSGTKTLPAVTSGRTIRIPITAADDTANDDDETITVRITRVTFNDAGGTDRTISIGSLTTNPATLTIQDDDLAPPPTLQNTVTRANPSEASTSTGGVTLTLSRALEASESVVVRYTLGGTATAADINQFSNLTGTKTLPAVTSGRTIRIPITAANDSEDDDSETVAVRITGVTFNDAGGTNRTIDISSLTPNPAMLTIQDNDTRGVTISQSRLTITEGSSGTYTVVLNTQPSGNVTVRPSSNDGDVTFTPASLTFRTSNWNSPQTVRVAAEEDDDAAHDSATLTHSVSGADYVSVSVAGVAVAVTDNDTRGVTISETALTIDEGSDGTYTVRLNTQPSGNVTVRPSSNDGDVTFTPASLTFRTSNWNSPQTVRVAAEEDDDAAHDSATLTHSVSGADYGSVTVAGVDVTVTDNDTRGVTISQSTLTVTEGSSGTYTVVLDTLPSGNVRVTIAGFTGTDVSVSPTTLTFTTTTETNTTPSTSQGGWNRPRTVTVTAGEDGDSNNDSATLTHGVRGADYVSVTADGVDVTVSDNDTPGVTISQSTLTITEGSSGTYTVRLNTLPGNNVTVTIAGFTGTDVTVNPTTLTFTTTTETNTTPSTSQGGWNRPRTVSVSAAEDDGVANDTAQLTHTVSGYGTVTSASPVAVTVTDNDTRGVTISRSTLTVTEESSSGTYTVVLDTLPSGNVTVTIAGFTGTDVTVSPTTLTFTTTTEGNTTPSTNQGGWNKPRTVSVSAGGDVDTTDDSATLTHSVSGADADYNSVTVASVTVTVMDNDVPGVTISETALTIDEGSDGTYTVVLNTQPSGNVTVRPSSNNGDVTFSPASLTFTTTTETNTTPSTIQGGWDRPRTVTVTAGEDNDAANDSATLTHRVSGADYVSVTAASVDVTVTDDDPRGVTISQSTLTVIEESSGGTYTVVLDTQPSGNVRVAIGGVSGDVSVSPTTLTFTTTTETNTTPSTSQGGWNRPRTVTVTAGDDGDSANDSATLTHSVSGADAGYNSVTVASVTVTVTDNDTPGVTINRSTLTITEGSSGTYTVRLNTLPGNNVTVTIAGFTGTDVTVNPTTLTFTTTTETNTTPSTSQGGWNRPRTVSVSAAEDDGVANDTAQLTHTVSGYGAVTSASAVAVTVTDNDTRGVTISRSTLTVTEESSSGTYTVVLDTLPSGNVTVTIAGFTGTDVTVSPTTLTFTTTTEGNTTPSTNQGGWNKPRTVSVSAGGDVDTTDDSATLTHSVSGADAGYNSVTAASVAVTVTDNDLAPLTLQNTVTRANPSEANTSTGGVTLTLSRALEASESVAVRYTLGGTATAADINQFSNLSGEKTLPTVTGGRTIRIPITATNDTADDGGETIIVTITGVTFNDADGTNHTISISSLTPNPARLIILDNDILGVCDRMPLVMRELLVRINENEESDVACEEVTSAHLAAIDGTFNVRSQRIASLHEGDFAGLTGVRSLSLRDNALTTLPEGVFAGLTSLQWLFLDNNDLTELPEGVFNARPGLQNLGLSGNFLTTLPAGLFNGLTGLRILDLHNNLLAALPAGLFNDSAGLQTLYLRDNDLIALPEGVFNGLADLQTLWLGSNPFTPRTGLPAGIFDDVLDTLRPIGGGFNVDAAVRAAHFVCSHADADAIVAATDGVDDCLRITAAQLAAADPPTAGLTAAGAPAEPPNDSSGDAVTGTFTLQFSPEPTTGTATVTYALTGSAVFNTDYTLTASGGVMLPNPVTASGTFTMNLAQTPQAVLTLTPAHDVHLEASETVILTVSGVDFADATPDLTSVAGSPQTLTIIDNDSANICDRTPVVESEILVRINEGEGPDIACDEVTHTHLAAIGGTLGLRSLSIASLQAGDFAGLTGLQALHLGSNDLTTLPEGVFNGLAGLQLQTLDLDGNGLTALSEGVFNGLAGLQTLYLGNNALSTLPEGVFNGLAELRVLGLDETGLTELPEGVFNGLTSLQDLDLYGNVLTMLPAGVFNGLAGLQILGLDGNGLTALPAGVFNGLDGLQRLGLSSNPLTPRTGLPAGIFDDVLDTLRPIGAGFHVDGTVRAAHFVCSRDDADAIVAATTGVDDCLRITTAQFDAATAPIAGLVAFGAPAEPTDGSSPGDAVTGRFRLWFSPAPATGTATVTYALTGAAALNTDYTLTASGGVTLPNTVTASGTFAIDFANLVESRADLTLTPAHDVHLETDETVILTVSGVDFTNAALPDLTFVAGSPQTLTIIDNDTANICDRTPAVQTAILVRINEGVGPDIACGAVTDTHLAAIDGTLGLRLLSIASLQAGDFAGLTGLQALHLGSNDLTTLPEGVFNGLAGLRLQTLDLDSNRLTALSEGVFNGLAGLQTLYLGNNALTTLPEGVFNGLAELRVLGLDETGLTELPESVFNGLTSLQDLDLYGNVLTALPAGVFNGLAGLQSLGLDGNGLTALPAGLFNGLAGLQRLGLSSNAFTPRTGLPAGIFDDVLDTLRPIGAGFHVDGTVRAAHFVCSRDDADAIVAATTGVDDCLRITTAQLAAATASTLPAPAIDTTSAPEFGATPIPDQVWTQNVEIDPFTLPEATGGDGTLTYAFLPALPDGVVFTADSHGLSGTPTASMVKTPYLFTATDEDGDAAAIPFHITVKIDPAILENQRRLAAQTRRHALESAEDQAVMITRMTRNRLGAVNRDHGLSISRLPDEASNMSDVTDGVMDALSLQYGEDLPSGQTRLFWMRNLRDGLLTDDDSEGVGFGLEWASKSGRDVQGLAVSVSTESLAFNAHRAGLQNADTYTWPAHWSEDMTIIAPYLTRTRDAVGLWAVAGLGVGDVRLAGGSDAAAADSTLAFLNAGSEWRRDFSFGPRLDVEVQGMTVHKAISAYQLGIYSVPEVAARLTRLSGDATLSWPFGFAGGTLTPRLEADGARDFADILPDESRSNFDLLTGGAWRWTDGIFSLLLEGTRSLDYDKDVSRVLSGEFRINLKDGFDASVRLRRNTDSSVDDASSTTDSIRFEVRQPF